MKAKEYLQQIKRVDLDIKRKQERIAELEETADAIRSVTDYDGLPHGSNIGHPTEQRAIAIADAKKQCADALLAAVDLKQEIWDKIEALGGLNASILYEHYFHWWQTWEEVGQAIGYSERHCTRLHGIALNEFRNKHGMK